MEISGSVVSALIESEPKLSVLGTHLGEGIVS
jgi:hypothetical protein